VWTLCTESASRVDKGRYKKFRVPLAGWRLDCCRRHCDMSLHATDVGNGLRPIAQAPQPPDVLQYELPPQWRALVDGERQEVWVGTLADDPGMSQWLDPGACDCVSPSCDVCNDRGEEKRKPLKIITPTEEHVETGAGPIVTQGSRDETDRTVMIVSGVIIAALVVALLIAVFKANRTTTG